MALKGAGTVHTFSLSIHCPYSPSLVHFDSSKTSRWLFALPGSHKASPCVACLPGRKWMKTYSSTVQTVCSQLSELWVVTVWNHDEDLLTYFSWFESQQVKHRKQFQIHSVQTSAALVRTFEKKNWLARFKQCCVFVLISKKMHGMYRKCQKKILFVRPSPASHPSLREKSFHLLHKNFPCSKLFPALI